MVDRISLVVDISGRSRYNKCQELFCAGKLGWLGLCRQSYHIEMEMHPKKVTNLSHPIYSVFSLSSWLPSSVDAPSCKECYISDMFCHNISIQSQGKLFLWVGNMCWTCFVNLGEQKKWMQCSVRTHLRGVSIFLLTLFLGLLLTVFGAHLF